MSTFTVKQSLKLFLNRVLCIGLILSVLCFVGRRRRSDGGVKRKKESVCRRRRRDAGEKKKRGSDGRKRRGGGWRRRGFGWSSRSKLAAWLTCTSERWATMLRGLTFYHCAPSNDGVICVTGRKTSISYSPFTPMMLPKGAARILSIIWLQKEE